MALAKDGATMMNASIIKTLDVINIYYNFPN